MLKKGNQPKCLAHQLSLFFFLFLFELFQLGPVELETVADGLPVGADILGENHQVSFTQHPVRIPEWPFITQRLKKSSQEIKKKKTPDYTGTCQCAKNVHQVL
jgi:hypothetical protein